RLDHDLCNSHHGSFGHVAGDSVLRQLAILSQRSLHPGDLAARYGGYEFAFIMPGMRAEEALDKVSYVCELIGRTPFQPEVSPQERKKKSPVRGVAILSASAGVSSYPSDSTEPEHLVHL